jgi:low affinity Fe/Cu permease
MLTITDYLLQRLDQSKIQKRIDKKILNSRDMKNSHVGHSSLSNEKREEAEYELYYVLIKNMNLNYLSKEPL